MFTNWTAIRESWISIFENTRMIKFFITNTKVRTFENIAIVVSLENIDTVIDNENSIRMGIIATNIFEQQNIKNYNNYNKIWLMIHHQCFMVLLVLLVLLVDTFDVRKYRSCASRSIFCAQVLVITSIWYSFLNTSAGLSISS